LTILKLKVIIASIVETLSIVCIYFFNTPIIFHVVPDDFSIVQQGILGSFFFVEHYARINYDIGCVIWKWHRISFKAVDSIVVSFRSNVLIKVSNPEIKSDIYHECTSKMESSGDSLVTCVNDKTYIRIINTELELELLILTVHLQKSRGSPLSLKRSFPSKSPFC